MVTAKSRKGITSAVEYGFGSFASPSPLCDAVVLIFVVGAAVVVDDVPVVVVGL